MAEERDRVAACLAGGRKHPQRFLTTAAGWGFSSNALCNNIVSTVAQLPLEGDDVAEERERIAAMPTDGSGDAIVVRGLRKVYPAQVIKPFAYFLASGLLCC